MSLSWNITAMMFWQPTLFTERLLRSCFSLVSFIINLVLLFLNENNQ